MYVLDVDLQILGSGNVKIFDMSRYGCGLSYENAIIIMNVYGQKSGFADEIVW